MASGDVENIKKTDIISKGKVGEEIKYLKNGQEVTGKLVTMSDNINYKRIFEMFTGKTSKGKVIHHMIEQQMTGFVGAMTEAFINNARRLKGIPQGIINDVVHLSKVRTMWDDMYKALDSAINRGMTDDEALKALLNFSKYTDDFIEASFKYSENMGSALTKDGLNKFAENWLKNNLVDKAIKDSIKNTL